MRGIDRESNGSAEAGSLTESRFHDIVVQMTASPRRWKVTAHSTLRLTADSLDKPFNAHYSTAEYDDMW